MLHLSREGQNSAPGIVNIWLMLSLTCGMLLGVPSRKVYKLGKTCQPLLLLFSSPCGWREKGGRIFSNYWTLPASTNVHCERKINFSKEHADQSGWGTKSVVLADRHPPFPHTRPDIAHHNLTCLSGSRGNGNRWLPDPLREKTEIKSSMAFPAMTFSKPICFRPRIYG